MAMPPRRPRPRSNFGFMNCSLDKIIGLTHPENAVSLRVLEKCGMALIDRQFYFGIELCRYWIEREEFFRQAYGGGRVANYGGR